MKKKESPCAEHSLVGKDYDRPSLYRAKSNNSELLIK